MDTVRAFIDEVMELYNCKNWDETIASSFGLTGFDWIDPRENDWDWRDVESDEFVMRSALEFLRPELNPYQLEILGKWDDLYKEWRNEGIIYERYEAANRSPKWSWQYEQEYAEETLGRKIPKEHWWYWPPDDKKKGE